MRSSIAHLGRGGKCNFLFRALHFPLLYFLQANSQHTSGQKVFGEDRKNDLNMAQFDAKIGITINILLHSLWRYTTEYKKRGDFYEKPTLTTSFGSLFIVRPMCMRQQR